MPYIGKSTDGFGIRERFTYVVSAGATSISGADANGRTLTFEDPEYVDVFLNGVRLKKDTDYNLNTANTISSLAALVADDEIEVIVNDVFTLADMVSANNGGDFRGNIAIAKDSGVLSFGLDKEITLTHSADAGLILKHAATADDSFPNLLLQTGDTDIAVNDVLGSIQFQAPDEGTGTDAILVGAAIQAISEGDFSSSNNATKLSFQTGASEAAAEKMSLSSAGVLTVSSNIVSSGTITGGGLLTTGGSIVIPDDGNIGSASDTNAIAISSAGVVTISTNTDATNSTSGALVAHSAGFADDVYVGDGLFVTGAITGSGAVQGTTITATTAFVPDASDGAALGTTSLEFSDLFLADGAVINFGADQDINITHVADTGLTTNGSFTASGTMQGTTITATTAFVPDASDGAALGSATLEFSDLFLADGGEVKFGADQDVLLRHDHNSGLIIDRTNTSDNSPTTLTLQTAETDIQADDVIGTINFQAPDEGTGTDAILVAAGIDAVSEGDFSSSNNATKLVFKTAASETASSKATLSSTGVFTASSNIITGGTFSGGNVVIPDAGNIGSASDTNAIGISSGGVVSITATTANTSASNGALTVAGGVGIAADLSVGDDLRLISDAAVLNFGADNDVTLTHVADTGLLLNSSRKLQFSGANDSIHSDGSKLILTSNGVAFSLPTADGSSGQTLVTNGSGVLSFAAASSNTPSSADGQALGSASLEWSDLFLADGGQILFGNDQEITLTHDADVGLKLKHTATADDKPIVLTLQTGETDMAANDVMGAIRFQAPDEGTGTDAILVAAAIQAVSEGDFSASSNATRLEFHTGASEAASSKMTLSSAGLLTIADDLMIKDGGTIGVASTNDAITISSAGIVTFKDDILIKDGGTIGSASDADAITIAANGQLTLTQTLIGTALDISGDMDIDGTSNMDVIDVDGTANFAGDVTIATGADLITATAGASNVRIGVNAGDSITSGTNYNVVVGDEAGTNLDGGDSNTLIGYKAGNAVTAGGSNTAVGYEALMTEDANGTNVAVGTGALRTQNAGADANNVAIGHTAGYNLTTGKLHTLVGAGAGLALTTGGSAAAVGYQSLYNSQDGGGNNAFGYRAGYNITSGNRNIAIGEQGMYGLTTANDCIGMGQQSFYATCTGSSNIGMGYRSFFSATSGHSNVGIGHQTLEDLSSADESVAIGYRALPHVSVSDSNIGIGAKTGDGIRGTGLTNGTANILIGREADTNAADTDYSIVMGVHAVAKGSSTGFISPNDGAVYQGNNSSSWSTTSDRRIKKNIVDNTVGLDAINKVQVKNFEYRTEDEITEVPSHARINKEGVQLGVIAQEIQTILPDMVNEESTGVLSVNPDNMTWYLVNAVQELSAKNDALEARIKELEGN